MKIYVVAQVSKADRMLSWAVFETRQQAEACATTYFSISDHPQIMIGERELFEASPKA